MRTYILLTISILSMLISVAIHAQSHPIGQFVTWKIKDLRDQDFESGYKMHLNWHKNAGETWDWYGWDFISGSNNDNVFIDATFDHSWDEFNNHLKPAEDAADNKFHVYPFADVQSVIKVARVDEASSGGSPGLRSAFVRFITIAVSDMEAGRKVLAKMKDKFKAEYGIGNFQTFQVIDGGKLDQLFLLIGCHDWGEYGKTVNLVTDLAEAERVLKIKAITGVLSETLRFRPELSLIH